MSSVDLGKDDLNRAELARLISAKLPQDGFATVVEGLRFNRASAPTDRIVGVTQHSLCIVAEGLKQIQLGDQSYQYDPFNYMLATMELPITGWVVQASPQSPYLSLQLELDPVLVGSVMVESGIPVPESPGDAKAVVISALGGGLLDAVVRLIQLLDNPDEYRILGPLIKREIVYRLLTEAQGSRLRHLSNFGGHTNRIGQAIDRLRSGYDQPLRIENLAKEFGMSSSSFHHHFKAVTDMSPLQYQKQLRLQEARRLMLGEGLDAASASYRVGYEDASHFSRDYKRHFGNAPIRDVERLRALAVAD